MKQDYEALIESFCRLCRIAAPSFGRIAAGEAVDIDGVNFVFAHDECAPDRLFVYCDYGAVPQGREAEVCRALLETNLVVYQRDTAVFTVSPASGHVICATRFALKPLAADELRGAMTFLSRKAKEWREHMSSTTRTDRLITPMTGDFLRSRLVTPRRS